MSKKQLRAVQQVVSGRIRAPENAKPTPNQLRPKFSLEYMQKSHCLSLCEKDEKVALIDRMHELSQLTWQQIQQAPRHGQGHEIIDQSSIKPPMPSAITEDVKILSFRFCGKAPMVGFRRDEVFYIVWLDRAFDVYQH